MQPKEALRAPDENRWFFEETDPQLSCPADTSAGSGKKQLHEDRETAGRLAACVITGQKEALEDGLQQLRNILRAEADAGIFPALRRLQRIPKLIASQLSVRDSRIGSLLWDTASDMLLYPTLEACVSRLRADLITVSSILTRPPEQDVVQLLMRHLSRHYMEPLQLKSISPEFGYESVYLGKLFRQKTGMSFHSCLNRIRIDHALEMLASGMRVTDVAEKCGYPGIQSFSRKFTELVGCSPGVYRAQCLKSLSGPQTSD